MEPLCNVELLIEECHDQFTIGRRIDIAEALERL